MSEQRALLLDTAERVLRDGAAWAVLEEAGLPLVLVAEADGGFGGDWGDVAGILKLAGKYACAHPLAAAILGAHRGGDDWDEARVFRTMAFLRAAEMAGALEAALDLSVQYTRQRQQFGKALASFQAIQQQLAVLAEETAAAGMAADAAAVALDNGDGAFACAAAKLRANRAAAVATGIAHQVHGAMGFTQEYDLQKFTRRLWVLQSEFGNERYWADRIGAGVAARGAENFWGDFVSL